MMRSRCVLIYMKKEPLFLKNTLSFISINPIFLSLGSVSEVFLAMIRGDFWRLEKKVHNLAEDDKRVSRHVSEEQ